MNDIQKGLLVVVSGPSGAGKGTVLERTISNYPNLKYSVSVTTRLPREGEIDGVNYFFKTEEEYAKMLANDEFLETQCVYERYYGTPKENVFKMLDKGYDVVLEIDVKGALEVKTKYPQAVMIFLSPSSREIIETRLRGRGTESEEQLQVRLNSAMEELKQASLYQYLVINDDDAHRAAMDIISIIQAEKRKISNCSQILNNLIFGGKNL